MPHVAQTRPETIQQDAAAALARCASGRAPRARVSVGFCFGGAQSFLAATSAGVGFDAAWSASTARWRASGSGSAAPLHRVAEHAPPGARAVRRRRPGDPGRAGAAFEAGLEEAGVQHEIVIYPGAPHSFFDRRYEEHAEACEDAWRRVLGFARGVGAPV